ncbi:hypothetical protein DV495_001241 [Geotrichum candidum]|nr:hypothetical protein DV495_001241 [Geotrichum candidum]
MSTITLLQTFANALFFFLFSSPAEQLALQQRIEALQSQQQRIEVLQSQQQQFLNTQQQQQPHSLMPPLQFNQQQSYQTSPSKYVASTSHSRTNSSHSRSNSSPSGGHHKRHSLVLSEAKRAAAIAQSSSPKSSSPSPISRNISSGGGSNSGSGFRFPSISPDNSTSPISYSPQQQPQPSGSSPRSHTRSNSRNFESNWRQSTEFQPQFSPGHKTRGSISRKQLFNTYIPLENISQLLNEGRLVTGTLRVNKKNRSDAYVSTNVLDADIFICGSKDRNRALEGDLVAVELLDVDEVWDSKREKEEKKKRKDNAETGGGAGSPAGSTTASSGTGLRRKGSLKQRPVQKKNDDVEVEGQSLLLVEEEALTDEVKPLYAGHIVAIISRIPNQTFSGTLGLLRPSSQATKEKQEAERKEKFPQKQQQQESTPVNRPKIVWFKPTDKRVPLIAIPTEQAPPDFVENSEKYLTQIFVASIKRWPETSLHPFGNIVDRLGSSEDDNTRIEAMLRDNNFGPSEFPESVIAQIPSLDTLEKIVDASKFGKRDFLNEVVVGYAARTDLVEEAIHIKKLSNEYMELGVHIVDASRYITPKSPLDVEASKRGASAFLRNRTYNMLPEDFNRNISFQVGRKSLAFSIICKLEIQSTRVVETWIGESIIQPQNVITFDEMEKVLLDKENTVPALNKDYIRMLSLISDKFRKQRLNLDPGVANLPPLGLLNYIEDEPINVRSNIFEGDLVSSIIDEINIQVNTVVAYRIYEVLGPHSFLRKQNEPNPHKLRTFLESASNLNLHIDISSSASIQASILDTHDDSIRKALEALLYKSMSRARYYVAGKNDGLGFGHYFLNLPLYTHFTSPLRNYADLIVHRQLRTVLIGGKYEVDDIDFLSEMADFCTFKKDCAKNAQEQSVHLEICQDIEKRTVNTGQLVMDAIVIQVYESAFDVLIPGYGVEKRVHGDQLPLRKAEFNKQTRLLELYWERGVDSATFVPEIESKIAGSAGPSRTNSVQGRQRVRASSAASALAQEQGGLEKQLAKLRLSGDDKQVLAPYFENVVTRDDGVQEIRVLQHVPVLLSAEVESILAYLFQITIQVVYAGAVLIYSIRKRKFAYHRKSLITAFISIAAVLMPLIFFILDLAEYWITGWSEFIRWVSDAAASVVVWEWIDVIEKLEREEQKNGVLGRQIYEENDIDLRNKTKTKTSTTNVDTGSGSDGDVPGEGGVSSGLDPTENTGHMISKRYNRRNFFSLFSQGVGNTWVVSRASSTASASTSYGGEIRLSTLGPSSRPTPATNNDTSSRPVTISPIHPNQHHHQLQTLPQHAPGLSPTPEGMVAPPPGESTPPVLPMVRHIHPMRRSIKRPAPGNSSTSVPSTPTGTTNRTDTMDAAIAVTMAGQSSAENTEAPVASGSRDSNNSHAPAAPSNDNDPHNDNDHDDGDDDDDEYTILHSGPVDAPPSFEPNPGFSVGDYWDDKQG